MRIRESIGSRSTVILKRFFCAKDLPGRFRSDVHSPGSSTKNLAESLLSAT